MKCKLSEKCEFGNLCKDATRHDSLTVLGCSSFKTKKPMTNDEWRKTCSTEEFAEFLFIIGEDNWLTDISNRDEIMPHEKDVVEWLKQPHSKGVTK